jgi:hypothetical protein
MTEQAIRFKNINTDIETYNNIQSIRDSLTRQLGCTLSTKQTLELIVKYHIEQNSRTEMETLKYGTG